MKRLLLAFLVMSLVSSAAMAYDSPPLYVELGPTGQKVAFNLTISNYKAQVIVSGTHSTEMIRVKCNKSKFQFDVWIGGTKYSSSTWDLNPATTLTRANITVGLDEGSDLYVYQPWDGNTTDAEHPTHNVSWTAGANSELCGIQTGNANDVVTCDSDYDDAIVIVSLNGGNDTYNGAGMDGLSKVWSGAAVDSVTAGIGSEDELQEGNDGSTNDNPKNGFETVQNNGDTEYWFTLP